MGIAAEPRVSPSAQLSVASVGVVCTSTGPGRWAILTRARFADGKRTPLKWLCVELADHFLSDSAIRKLHERESAWTTGLAIDRHGNVGGLCDGR